MTSSATPSSTMTLPPPPPSSAGWKKNLTVPPNRLAHPREGVGRADEHASVPVVAAGVHLAVCLRGERQARLLLDRQRVHVRPQRHRRTVSSPFKRGDDPVLGDAGLYVEGQTVESSEHLLGGLLRVEAQLGLAVDVAPERDDLLAEAFLDLFLNLRTCGLTLISDSLPRGFLSLQRSPTSHSSLSGRPDRRIARQPCRIEAREQVGESRALACRREAERASHPGEDFSRALRRGPLDRRASPRRAAWPDAFRRAEHERDVGVSGLGQAEHPCE